MSLNKTQIDELNELLKDKAINIPDFRRTVTHTGQNAQWLKKKLNSTSHPNLPTRVRVLLGLI